jgi:hypothetical protein
MIAIHPISPENEMAIAERLRDTIATVWPDVATSERDHIDILVGVRTDVDVDFLVFVNLERAREIPQQRRSSESTCWPFERHAMPQTRRLRLEPSIDSLARFSARCVAGGTRTRRLADDSWYDMMISGRFVHEPLQSDEVKTKDFAGCQTHGTSAPYD